MSRKPLVESYDLEKIIPYLENRGYVVKKLKNYKSFSDPSILAIFYDLIEIKFGADQALLSKQCFDKINRNAIKTFQKSAESLGYTKKFSNYCLVHYVRRVFEYYDYLDIKGPILSLEKITDLNLHRHIYKYINIADKNRLNSIEDSEEYVEFFDKACDPGKEKLYNLFQERRKELLKLNGQKK